VEVGRSSLWETEPVDVKPEFQHLKFINAVLIVESVRHARDWLTCIGEIERGFGRTRPSNDKNAPREIDIDIIFAGDSLIGSGGLIVPHPRWASRRFVVAPLAELQPDRILPGAGGSVAQVLSALPVVEDCLRLDLPW
jgi:2-amino-4-hydroxy-6-hydroxymethyldihydropteridine diphosphokinase